MNALTVIVFDSSEGWQKLAPQWNTLLDASNSASIFLTWEWLSAWAECCLGQHRTVFVLATYEKEDLVGVAPFYLERKKKGPFILREIHFLGAPDAGSDYLDVFARRGREREVASAIYDFLMSEGKKRWDLMHLQDIPADALFLLHFMKRIQADGKYAEMAHGFYCPVARLPDTDAEFLEALSPSRRKKFSQEARVLHREQDVTHTVIQGEEVACRLAEFFSLYEEKGGRSGKKIHSILQSFSERCNGDSPVQIDMLSAGGQTVAALLHLRYRSTLALYLMAVDKEFNPKLSIGNILVGLCIKNSIAAGHSAYDFLKGEESYKFHWANEGRSTMELIFWQKRPAAVASGLARLAKHAGKLLLR